MQKIIIDTSIFIDYVRTGKSELLDLIELCRQDQVKLYISSLVLFEFWSGRSMRKVQTERQAEVIFSIFEIINVNDVIAKQAGILQRLKYCEGIDALIAATALQKKAKLFTLNKKHFSKVPELKLW